MDEVLVEIGLRVRSLRLASDWSQQRLADTAGVSRPTINYLEQGKLQARRETLNAVAGALGVPVGELLGTSGPPPWEMEAPEVTVEAVYRVVCAACGPVDEVGEVGLAVDSRNAHAALFPHRHVPARRASKGG